MTSTASAAYGPIAQRFARTLAPDLPVVVFDHAGIAEALKDCAARRFRNDPFLVRAILQRDYALRCDAVIPSVLSSISGLDERRFALEQAFAGVLGVNGQPLSSIAAYDANALRLMQAAVRLADGLLVSSEAERRRVCDTLFVDPAVVVPAPASVPSSAAAATRTGIVIWAPQISGTVASAFALALADFRLPLLLISADAPPADIPARWIAAAAAQDALRSAQLIVDTNAFGCDDASKLASFGAPLVADVESGAQEFFENVRSFDRRRMSSIPEAAISALGMLPPRAIAVTRATPPPLRAATLLENGPRVSVMIPTLDRPAMLREALESVARQSYKNVETIVVVDGGPRLDALAAEFPAVTFLHLTENNPVVSSNTAFARTSGEYVTLLSDDDLFFPDHVAELVSALERSGASVAHGDVVTAFLRGSGDEGWTLYGLESNMSRTAEASALLVSNQVGAVGVMFRRSAVGDEPPFDASIAFCRDYALWLRLSAAHDFIHVERVTSCYTIRNRGAQQQSVMWSGGTLEGYKTLYARYPVAGRPLLQQRREQIIQSISQGRMGLAGEPAAEVAPVPWPFWVRR